jgi:hypothetical protein
MADKDHLDIDEQAEDEAPDDGILTQAEVQAIIQGYEKQFGMTSEEFRKRWIEGTVPDTFETNDWVMLLDAIN